MIIFKWFLIVLVSIDFLADFASKMQDNKKWTEFVGTFLGVGLRLYVVYILITVWSV